MDDSRATSLEQLRALVAANGVVRFAGQRRDEVYGWMERTLVRHEYAGLPRPDKGVVRLYLTQMTGLSRAQVTRLITRSEEHTSELQSLRHLVCRLLLEKTNNKHQNRR